MRSVGKGNKNKIKILMKEAYLSGIDSAHEAQEYVIDKLPLEVFDTWEGAYSEIESIIWDTFGEIIEQNRSLRPYWM